MSKGNMLLGYARGKVGDVVFQRLKGQQITKARNRHPFNPRSFSQMYQRAKFTRGVLFYKHGIQAYYKFAYEGKLERESDYNAFMRYNTERSYPIPRANATNPFYPAIGTFIISRGSLDTISGFTLEPSTEGGTADTITLPLKGMPSDGNVKTVAQLSSAFLTTYPSYQEGDFITFIIIQVYSTAQNILSSIDTPLVADRAPSWSIFQIKLDTRDTSPIEYSLDEDLFIFSKDGLKFPQGPVYNGQMSTQSPLAVGIIASRRTTNKTYVSTSELYGNVGWNTVLEYYETATQDGEWPSILESWGWTADAILRGSIAEPTGTNKSARSYSPLIPPDDVPDDGDDSSPSQEPVKAKKKKSNGNAINEININM